MRLERIARLSDLQDRKPLRLRVEGHHLCLVLNDGQVYAFPNRCPHTGARLDDGRVRNNILTCMHHLAQFDLKTGAVLSYPMEDLHPESTGPLTLYHVEIDDDWITVSTEAARWSVEED